MSIVDGWVSWAVRKDGILPSPTYRTYSKANTMQGITWHSAVANTVRQVEASMLNPNRSFSVMFILDRDGTLNQYYPVTASPWCSGSKEANTTTWCVEALGGSYGNFSEPLTDEALESSKELIEEWASEVTGFPSRTGTTAPCTSTRSGPQPPALAIGTMPCGGG